MRHHLRRFCADAGGATAIEYAMIAATVALGIVSTISLIAPELNRFFGEVTSLLN